MVKAVIMLEWAFRGLIDGFVACSLQKPTRVGKRQILQMHLVECLCFCYFTFNLMVPR